MLTISDKAFDICDEDIQQTLPGTLEAFEAGVRLLYMILQVAEPTHCAA